MPHEDLSTTIPLDSRESVNFQKQLKYKKQELGKDSFVSYNRQIMLKNLNLPQVIIQFLKDTVDQLMHLEQKNNNNVFKIYQDCF